MTKNHAVVVDIGGSGSRIARVTQDGLQQVARVGLSSYEDLVRAIRQGSGEKLEAVVISIAGFVNTSSGFVRLSRSAPWLEGQVADWLAEDFACRAVVLNDGEAHALAMLETPDVEFGALSVSIGTSVGIGLIGHDSRPIHPCSDENWDLGAWQLHTRASQRDLWWALGSNGLAELERDHGRLKGAKHFGYRLGNFLAQMTTVFQPRTVVLSGGVINAHWSLIEEAARGELLQGLPQHYQAPLVVCSPFVEAALVGAARAITLSL